MKHVSVHYDQRMQLPLFWHVILEIFESTNNRGKTSLLHCIQVDTSKTERKKLQKNKLIAFHKITSKYSWAITSGCVLSRWSPHCSSLFEHLEKKCAANFRYKIEQKKSSDRKFLGSNTNTHT